MPLLGLLSRARARLCGEVRACGRLASGRALRELPQAPARDPGARDPQGRAAQVRGPQRHAPSSEEDAQEFVLMTIALQVFVTGLAAGGVYGLFAAGHTLIYRLTGMVNFAFGDLVGLGVFATLLVLAGTAPVTQSGAHEPRFLGALVVGLVFCVSAGILTYFGLVQPYLARGSTIALVAGTAPVASAIRAAIGAAFQRSSYGFPDPLPFHRVGHAGFIRIGGAQVQARAFFVIGLALALPLGSPCLLEKSRCGRALRADRLFSSSQADPSARARASPITKKAR